MSTTNFYLCAIPRVVWEQPAAVHGQGADVAGFAADALGCEQRIAKEVNLENEYSRYTLCCQRLEQEIVLSGRLKLVADAAEVAATVRSTRFPAVILAPGYLSLLAQAPDQSAPERLGASFFPPDQVGAHRTVFAHWAEQQGMAQSQSAQQRLAFFLAAEQAGCGVVELQSAFHIPTTGEAAVRDDAQPPVEQLEEQRQFITIPEFVRTGEVVEPFGQKKKRLAATLRGQIREALKTGEPVGFGNEAQHDVIAEVLNELVFVPQGQSAQPLSLRVVYADGSEAQLFPLFCLPRITSRQRQGSAPPLRVALMSMRHLELDPEIDFCWFRNRDVSRTRTLAETDQFCFDTTLSQLRDSLALGDLIIHLYHTGFEPSVIGFYRGVVQTLLELRARQSKTTLAVVPFYYRGETAYQPGTEWC
ncbi:MAG: hypothetical protein U1F42_11355 [Candidatus Competibacteraceae bacterium]